jgi:hypothetical protein
MNQIYLNVEPYLQPKPTKNPGGDCFACALTAALSNLFPENKPTFEQVWDYFYNNYYNSENKGLHNSWTGMDKALFRAKVDYDIEHEYHFVQPVYDGTMRSNTFYMSMNLPNDYIRALEGRLSSGWIMLAEISYKGEGAFNSNGQFNDSDHFVVIDGIKEEWERVSETAKMLCLYVHIVCSVKGVYWIKVRDLLYKYGTGAWWCVRKNRM